jgi:hypothetical protein
MFLYVLKWLTAIVFFFYSIINGIVVSDNGSNGESLIFSKGTPKHMDLTYAVISFDGPFCT